jgi:hypothetical protein
MAKHKTRRRAPYKPAIDEGQKGVVVSVQRAKWKLGHWRATQPMIRMVRFVWMRDLHWEDKHKLHSTVLGACMRAGMIWREEPGDESQDRLRAIDPRRIKGYEP